MKNELLISEELFKDYSPVTNGVDTAEFFPYTLIAQKLYIDDLLGIPLLEQLLQQIEDGLTPENKVLIVKIAPCLAYYTIYHGLGFHAYRIVQKGVTASDSDNSTTPSLKDIEHLRTQQKDTAEAFRTKLLNFLADNAEQYPLWYPPVIEPTLNQGIFFPQTTYTQDSSGYYFDFKFV